MKWIKERPVAFSIINNERIINISDDNLDLLEQWRDMIYSQSTKSFIEDSPKERKTVIWETALFTKVSKKLQQAHEREIQWKEWKELATHADFG